MKITLANFASIAGLNLLSLFCGVQATHAALIAADDFIVGAQDYPGGSVNFGNINTASSIGFTGNWQGDVTAFFLSGSDGLSFDGAPANSGSLIFAPTSNGNYSRNKARTFSPVSNASQMWFSTLYRPGANAFDANREVMMGFLSDRLPTGGQSSYDGAIWSNANGGSLSGFAWGLVTGDTGSAALTVKYQSGLNSVETIASGFSFQQNTTYMLLGQLSVNGAGNDVLNLWALTSMPTSEGALGAPTLTLNSADLLNNSSQIDTLAVWAGETQDSPSIQQINTFDSVKIGTNFASVIPEPATAGLILTALMGVAIKRKRPASRIDGMMLLGFVLCLSLPTQMRAAVISYEGFNYATGTLSGKNPGAGWNGAWSSNGTLVTGSLGYPASTGFTPTGNSVALTSSGSTTFSASIQYGLDFRYSMSSNTVRYASFVASKPTAAPGGEFLQMELGNWLFGMSSGESFLIRSADSVLGTNVEAYSSSVIQANTSYLLVSKLETSSSGKDKIYLNWYAVGDVVPVTEPTTWMLSIEVDNTSTSTHTTLSISSGSSAGTYAVDEIRLGTTWQDVAAVPEPAKAVLILAGLLGVLMFRRR